MNNFKSVLKFFISILFQIGMIKTYHLRSRRMKNHVLPGNFITESLISPLIAL